MWSDSTIVLHWIRGQSAQMKNVSNRDTEIQGITDPSIRPHCSINIEIQANLLTSGLSGKDLINSKKMVIWA